MIFWSGKMDGLVAKDLFLNLSKHALGRIDLLADERERDVEKQVRYCSNVGGVASWLGILGMGREGKELSGDDGEDHED